MKHVILKELHLVNFKGAKDLKIPFSNETTISGDNGTGKTRNFTAFIWLLFGKDQFDRKDFEILTIENGKVLDRVEAEVSGILDVDGNTLSLRRVYRQVWQRRRADKVERMVRHETLYYVDDVPLSAAEYKAKVDTIIDETVFKLITNPDFFFTLDWKKQREHLFNMAGTISDEEVAAMKPEFRALLDSISGTSFDEYRRKVNARKKKLQSDLDEISPRIDQTRRMMPEPLDFKGLESDLKNVESELSNVNNAISDKAAAIRLQYEGIQQKQGEINALKKQQQEVVFRAEQEAQRSAFEINSSRRNIENDLTAAKNDLIAAQREESEASRVVLSLKENIGLTELDLEKYRKDWAAENGREYQAGEGCLVCPVFGQNCGDASANEKHEEAQAKAKAAFFEIKTKNLEALDNHGGKLTESIKTYSAHLGEAEKNLSDASAKVVSANGEVDRLQKLLSETTIVGVAPVVPGQLSSWVDLQAQITEIEATIKDVNPVDDEELQGRRKELEGRRDELKTQFAAKDRINECEEEIKSLEEEGRNLSQQIADVEKDLVVMDDFTKTKIRECEGRVNDLFTLVNFQLFDRTIENKDNEENVFEVCIPKNKAGVPIGSTNTAEEINAGLDIINTLCRFHNVTAPIFIDGRESVNRIISTESQIINLKVTEEKKLSISNS